MRITSHLCKNVGWYVYLTLVLFTALNIQVFAQNENIRFRHINSENGLSGNTALSVAQDKEGFMWFGTLDGLNKFDGYNITNYQLDPRDSLSISSNRINDILVAEDGNLWIGTDGGLNYFQKNKNQFTKFAPPAFEFYTVQSLTKDSKNRLWVGAAEGLYQFDMNSKAFIRSGVYPNKPYTFLEKNVSEIKEDKDGALWLCTHEGLYILENEVISKASVKAKHSVFSSIEFFRDILVDANGDYWIASESLEEGVFRFDSELNFIQSYSNIGGDTKSLAGNKVRILRQLSDGRIWFGSYSGLSVFDPEDESFQNYQSNKYNRKSLSYNSVQDIFEDREGGIWIATYSGGINYFHPEFQNFKHELELWQENSISNNQVWGFAQDKKGNLWIGTENGLNFRDGSTYAFKHFYKEQPGMDLLDNTSKTIVIDKESNLWIGSLLGLSLIDKSKKYSKHFVHDPLNVKSIGYGQVLAICEDRNSQLWIGTQGGGLNRYNFEDNSFEKYTQIENERFETIDSRIQKIIEYQEEMLWIGTERGLELFNTRTGLFTRSKLKEDGVFASTSIVSILSLFLEGENNLWIGTNGNGLLIYNTEAGEIFRIDSKAGLPSNTVNGILEDNLGNFWISTNRGISKLIRPVGGWQNFDKSNIINFNVSDGLQGLQFNPNSAFKSRSGQLFFGGTNGYNSFNPDEVEKTNIQPKVVFTDIRFWNDISMKGENNETSKQHLLSDTLTIMYSQNDFSIGYAALNYLDPDHTLYAYKLEPIDQDWIPIGSEHSVNYSNLPYGDYFFKVRATNDPLNWGDNYNQLTISVLPPIWLTWWAYVFYILIIIGLLYVFFTIATRWGRLKSDLSWEHLEREKEQELHQQRVKFFTDISHELRTPLTLILAPLERLVDQFVGSTRLKNQLLMIQRNGERMLQLINQLLDLRKLETGHLHLQAGYGNIVKFIHEVSLAFREMATYKNINYEVLLGEEVVNIWFDRDKFEVILYNLLSNAIKYTPAGGNIGIGLNTYIPSEKNELVQDDLYAEGYVEISVEDDGKGIPSENLPRIFDRFYQSGQQRSAIGYGSGVGLEIVKKFVELHKGTINVNSIEAKAGQPGKTRFIIKLPIGKSHLSNSEMVENFKNSEDITLYNALAIDKGATSEQIIIDESMPAEESVGDKEKATLLVVEDNDDVRKFIVSLFESEYELIEASNGEQGLEYAYEKIPDLILSDIMMPGIDGLEVCKRIKSDQRTSHVPVVLLTARTAVTFQIEGMETGADDYITKPFSANLLKTRVRKLIEQRDKLRNRFSRESGLIPEEISINSVDEKLMEKAIAYINKHISDPDLSVEKVAGEVGLSRVHFYRKLKALTNLSPVQFIRLIRLERAAQLLKSGKLNVSEVRYAVGFQDADYFRKAFKEHFGHVPSDHAEENASPESTGNPDL